MNLFDELRENAVADNNLLVSNDAQGDVFSVAREVDFAFKTKEQQNAEDLKEFVNGMNYGHARVEYNAEQALYWVFVVIHTPVTQNVICSLSAFMVCLARLFKVDYDGWGSVIQKT